jgi:hypothetical protein
MTRDVNPAGNNKPFSSGVSDKVRTGSRLQLQNLLQIVPKRAEQTLPLATSLLLPLKQLRLSRNCDGPWFPLVCNYYNK